MLLCVAGGSSSGFNRERSREGARCSTQNSFLRNNAHKQIMVEERCSMTSTAVNVSSGLVATQDKTCLDPRASRSVHNKHEKSITHRAKVIVVRNDDAGPESANNGETCATTTTFRSNVVNGTRSTNTILVRYKSPRTVSQSSEDEFKNEFSCKSNSSQHSSVSSSSSTASGESTSSAKDKVSVSAWAQIMELEGYRSPAIGLDSAPKKNIQNACDDESTDGSVSESNASVKCCSDYNPNHYSTQVNLFGNSCCSNPCDDKNGNSNLTSVNRDLNSTTEDYNKSLIAACHRPASKLITNGDEIYKSSSHIIWHGSKCESDEKNNPKYSEYASASSSNCSDKISEDSLTLHCSLPSERNSIKVAQKVKSPMYRSESSRVPKAVHQEKKSRRKTLPDGNIQFNDGNSQVNKCINTKQSSVDIDPNASWGRYNSKAMRDSVRKVAQKYAEVYFKRQSRSQLDSLHEFKGVQLTRYAFPSSNRDHVHSSSKFHCAQSNLYCSRITSVPSHLHQVTLDSEPMFSKSHKWQYLTHHDHSAQLKNFVMNCPHKNKEMENFDTFEKGTRFDPLMKENHFENESVISNSDGGSSVSSQAYNSSGESESPYCDKNDTCTLQNDRGVCEDCRTCKLKYSKSYQSFTYSNLPKVRNFSLNNTNFQSQTYDIKSKLCADCVHSAQSGPPSKQPSSRSKCHKNNLSFPNSPSVCSTVSNVKKLSVTLSEVDSSENDHRHFSYKDDSSCKHNSTSKHCTRLTAREMNELIHGNNSAASSDKISHAGVTNKVTNWIQKQRDKRKPVFFIGDTPFFSNKDSYVPEKSISRKSKRSLSLSSVREGEISANYKALAESSFNLSSIRLSPSDGRDHEHRHLYIKRASSTCSNRGSARRKIRQGSPVREEKESVTKKFNDTNKVDRYIASCKDKVISERQNVDQHLIANHAPNSTADSRNSLEFPCLIKGAEDNINSPYFSYNSEVQHNFDNEPLSVNQGDCLSSENSNQNLESLTINKNERSSFSKKLLNIKQLTRALSLHSLKKKAKEPLNERDTSKSKAELTSYTQLSKWTRTSKRKLGSGKYGSLRKSVSYCELTVREADISEKSKSQVVSHTEVKSASKPSARASVPLTNSICCCSATLRRSVSLYANFPLNRCLEYSVEDPKSDFLARLCVSRLCNPNGIPPFFRQLKNKKISDKMKDSILSKKMHPVDTPEHSMTLQIPVIVLKPESLSIKNECISQKKKINGNEEKSPKPDVIMGLGNTYALNESSNCSSIKMVEEYVPFNNSTKIMENHLPVSVSKSKGSSGLRLRTKAISKSERHAKGKSTSELCGRTVRKTISDTPDSKKRPTSQFYDLDELDCKSDSSNGPNLLQLSSVSSGSQPILSSHEEISNIPQGSSGLITRHLSLHTSSPQLSPADSLLQRFRKSFAQRFHKKKPEPSAPNLELLSTTIETPEISVINSNDQRNILNTDVVNSDQVNSHSKSLSSNNYTKNSSKSLENKLSPRSNSKQTHSCLSDGRKKNRRKPDWRVSLIYDSVDSIFDSTNKTSLNKCHGKPNFTGSDANILRKRAASTSDYSPKSKSIQRPVSVADYLTLENSPCTKVPDGQNDLTRTASDTTSSEEQQKNLTSLDQIWRANPVKLCRVHSRLLMCRHKGRYRLRRSISQPVELEMTGSVHNLRDSTHGSADHENFQKGSLSSDDEASSESDIYHSYCCSPTRRSNTCWELSGDGTMYAEALWDHETIDPEELPFLAGDIIEVTDTSDQDWWWGTKDGHGGWFPSAFVRLYVSHRTPSLHFNGQQSDGIQIPYSPCKVSMNNLSCEQVRANIVQEIVATERDYVKHLKDVVEGYLKQVQRRPDMFSKERIETVFGNIKEIYAFQSQFLKQLEDCLDKDIPHLSQIGNVFLKHKEEFKMYSQYCNNHPLAVSELQELYCDSQYIHFFEACRLLQEMIDISLDGFLLTPIQRICKYPLQLAELLKFTDSNHPDHVPVTNALAAMKEVAELVNERKRRMECLERIAEWQNTIEGWEGPDVLDTSSILIHCGEVTRVSSSWSRDIYLFIFDHLLIYCKKDLLKRHTYAYKGRLNLDNCDIVDVEDGKDSQFAVNVKNAWKIYCKDKDKWYLFYAKTTPEKDQWIRAFKAERQRVIDDEKQAFVVTEEAKKSARLAVHNKQKPKRPRAKFTKGRRCHPDVAVTELLLDSPSAKARSGSLPSNIHPELAIMAGAKLGPTRKKGSGWFHFGSGKKPKS